MTFGEYEKARVMSEAEWIKRKRRMKKDRRIPEKQLKLDRRLEFKMYQSGCLKSKWIRLVVNVKQRG
jgi:hypothetical protein